MVVDVYFGPCSDPGSNPGVSTKYEEFNTTISCVFVCLDTLAGAERAEKDQSNQTAFVR